MRSIPDPMPGETGIPAGATGDIPSRQTDWTTVDWSHIERQITIDGRSLNYVEVGDQNAPAVILLHGIMGRWQHWLPNLLDLAEHHRVVAIDFPGFGESALPAGALTLEHYAAVTGRLCDRLNIQRATIVGNSMGGYVATLIADRNPALVERLVLVDPSGFSTADGPLAVAKPLLIKLDRLLRIGPRTRQLIARSRLARAVLLIAAVAHPIRLGEGMANEILAGLGRPAFTMILPQVLGDRITEHVDHIDQPTMIIWGRYDLVIPKADARRYSELCGNSRLVVIEGAGHLPMIDQPRRFNDLVTGFVQESTDPVSAPKSPAADR